MSRYLLYFVVLAFRTRGFGGYLAKDQTLLGAMAFVAMSVVCGLHDAKINLALAFSKKGDRNA